MAITLCAEPMKEVIQSVLCEERRLIDDIIETKRILNPWDMVSEINKPGGAWDSVYRGGDGKGSVIPKNQIRTLG